MEHYFCRVVTTDASTAVGAADGCSDGVRCHLIYICVYATNTHYMLDIYLYRFGCKLFLANCDARRFHRLRRRRRMHGRVRYPPL